MSRNDLPSPNAANFGQRLREAVMTYLGRQGDPLDRGVTLRDLLEGGLARLRPGYTAVQAAASGGALPIAPEVQAEEPDLTPPPTPTGFAVSAAISHVFIEHDAPLYLQGHGHLRTRVYGKVVAPGDPLPVFADAVEITQFTGTIHAHPSNPATTWRLWIKWESADGVLSVSPAGGTNGLAVTTGQDVSKMVEAMTGSGKPFTVLTEPTVIGGVTFPAATYSTQAFIQDGQVTNAKIANLAVDDAKIADLSVAKLNGAEMKVGAFIQSTNYTSGPSGNGWRINADGTAEMQAAFIRGLLTASQIDSRGLSIRDASNNIILAAGTPLSTDNISGLGALATASSVDYSGITGAKPPANADKTADNTAAGIANQGAFATLNQITKDNASTYIADAAITNAKIGNILQSANFNGTFNEAGTITDNGTLGWAISKAGKMVLDDLVVRQVKSASAVSNGTTSGGDNFGSGVSSFNYEVQFSTLATKGFVVSCGVSGNLLLYLNTSANRLLWVQATLAAYRASDGAGRVGQELLDMRSVAGGLFHAPNSTYLTVVPLSLTWLFQGDFWQYTQARPPGMSGIPQLPYIRSGTLGAGVWSFRLQIFAATYLPGGSASQASIANMRFSHSGWAMEHQGVLPNVSPPESNPYL